MTQLIDPGVDSENICLRITRSPGTETPGRDWVAENARRRKPRTPDTGARGRERPAQKTENTWHRSRRPGTSGAGNREHPVRIAEDTRPGQSSEDTRSPDPSDFRSSRCSIYTRNFARLPLQTFNDVDAPQNKIKCADKVVEVNMQRDLFGRLLRISLEKNLRFE